MEFREIPWNSMELQKTSMEYARKNLQKLAQNHMLIYG